MEKLFLGLVFVLFSFQVNAAAMYLSTSTSSTANTQFVIVADSDVQVKGIGNLDSSIAGVLIYRYLDYQYRQGYIG